MKMFNIFWSKKAPKNISSLVEFRVSKLIPDPWRIHGIDLFLPTEMVGFYGKLVGKYTYQVDPMGFPYYG